MMDDDDGLYFEVNVGLTTLNECAYAQSDSSASDDRHVAQLKWKANEKAIRIKSEVDEINMLVELLLIVSPSGRDWERSVWGISHVPI